MTDMHELKDGEAAQELPGAQEPPAHRPSRKDSKERFESNASRRARITMISLGILLIVVALVSFVLGKYPISVSDALGILGSKFLSIDQTWTDQCETMFLNVRLPRVILAMLVGCCLSAAGAAFQGTFQNPLVSPDILGASQGAAFGAALAILLSAGAFGMTVSAFIFSIVTVLLVLLISRRAKGNRILVVVLAGVMISSLFSAGVSYLKLIADPADELPAITYWLMGSLVGAKMSDVLMALPVMVVGCVTLFILRWKINILTMGDEEASTMGVDVRRLRVIIILAATLVTAASVSVTGMIGWVGLVIPHLSRMLVGSDYRKLLPTSMLMGSSFLLIVDDFARVITTTEIPIGILTAFIGAPFFLYLITRRRRV